MGNVGYPGIINTFGNPTIPSSVWELMFPNYLSTNSAITNQVKNTENKQTIRLLRKRKFLNVKYI